MRVLHAGLGDSKYRPCPLLVQFVDAGKCLQLEVAQQCLQNVQYECCISSFLNMQKFCYDSGQSNCNAALTLPSKLYFH